MEQSTFHDADFYEETKDWLAGLVADRNELMHHLLPLLDLNSIESCEKIGLKLDVQAEMIRQAIKHIQSIAKGMQDGMKKMASVLQIPGVVEWMISGEDPVKESAPE